MIRLLEEILRTKLAFTATGEPVKVHSSVDETLGEFMQEVIRDLQAKETVEVGLAYGISAMFICEALQSVGGHRHTAIDPYQSAEWLGIGVDHIERAGFKDLVEFHERPSYVVLPEMVQQGRTVDFAFVDGFTTFDYKLVDAYLCDKLLRVGGVMIIRTGEMIAGNKVCSYIQSNWPYRILKTCQIYPGTDWADLAIAFQKTGPDSRDWAFHAEF